MPVSRVERHPSCMQPVGCYPGQGRCKLNDGNAPLPHQFQLAPVVLPACMLTARLYAFWVKIALIEMNAARPPGCVKRYSAR